MGRKMSNGEPPDGKRSGFWEFASEHRIFSGIVGSLNLLVATIAIAVIANHDGSGAESPTGASAGSQRPAPQPEVELNEDGVVDVADESPYEPGENQVGVRTKMAMACLTRKIAVQRKLRRPAMAVRPDRA